MRKLSFALLALAWILVAGARAEVAFAPIFNNGAVLQCEMPVNVWGKSTPGAGLEIRLDGKKVANTEADAEGNWKAILPTQPPGGPHTLEAVSGEEAVKLADILFGEVWLATGQSNMFVPLINTDNGPDRLAKTIPEIRFVKVPRTFGLPSKSKLTAADLGWSTFKPGPNKEISAVAFYFAEKLQTETGRQVGIIQSSYGGMPCQAWTPEWALNERPELKYYADAVKKALAAGKSEQQWNDDANALDKWQKDLKQWMETKAGPRPVNPGPQDLGNPYSPKTATTLYENMIAPLVPYTARGVIWYQGEANAQNPEEYRTLFPAMINAWRKVWNRPDWPFYFVQLAAYEPKNQDWAAQRAAQTFARDTVPHTGMALAIDCGEKNDIHPKKKQPVGERLARLALANVYGKTIASRGPSLLAFEKSNGSLRVNFQGSENGLQTSDGKPEVPGFEVSGSDGVFHAAQAKIVSTSSVELTCSEVADPLSVRYAWANWPEPPVTLQNSAGLPAEPFFHSRNQK
jgi:sialate O-acetylesterase